MYCLENYFNDRDTRTFLTLLNVRWVDTCFAFIVELICIVIPYTYKPVLVGQYFILNIFSFQYIVRSTSWKESWQFIEALRNTTSKTDLIEI